MTPSQLIDKKIIDLGDWRGQTMADVRRIVREAVPDVTEEWKWMGTPTFSHNGILCICNAFKDMVKVTFMHGAKLHDEDGVFNAELDGNQWRAIKLFEGDEVKAGGMKKLLHAAVALNATKGKGKAKATTAGGGRASKTAAKTTAAPAKTAAKTAKPTAKTAKGNMARATAKAAKTATTKTATKKPMKATKKPTKARTKPAKA